jgi:hypothetical protein
MTKVPRRRWPSSSSTSLEFRGPTAFPDRAPFLSLFFRKASGSRCRDFRKCRPQGLATLSTVSANPRPGGCFSTPDAHGLRPAELFSFSVIGQFFRIVLSVPALSYKTLSDLVPALQRLDPTKKAAPTRLLPEGLTRGRACCSLGPSGLLGSLIPRPMP